MNFLKKLVIIIFLIFIFSIFHSCNVIKDVSNALTNISRLQFKLENVTNFKLAGIDISNKNSISDISAMDALKLTNAFATRSFPADFVLNIGALNPNDGTKGTRSTDATITSLDYRLLIDDVPTITGDISSPITIPGTGSSITIPLRMSLDLYSFFADKGYENIVNLAMAIGGVNGSAARLKLDVKPTVRTTLGPISYPSRITVIDKEWR